MVEGLVDCRDHAMVAVLLGRGLRRSELAELVVEKIQMHQGHWVIVDLVGKGGHIRSVPIPLWVKTALDRWLTAARQGRIGHGRPITHTRFRIA